MADETIIIANADPFGDYRVTQVGNGQRKETDVDR
jgi:hypothetical protein